METPKVNIKASMVGYGGKIVTAGTYTGNYCAIKALSESVVTAVGNIEGFTSITILGCDVILGEFTSVTVTSGTVLLVNDINGGS